MMTAFHEEKKKPKILIHTKAMRLFEEDGRGEEDILAFVCVFIFIDVEKDSKITSVLELKIDSFD